MQMKHTVRKLGGIGSSLVVVSVLTVLSLNGCGNNSIAPPAATPLSCAQLAGKTVPASSIGLPTTGATVTAATTMPASGTGAQATGEYCLVSGAINPVD